MRILLLRPPAWRHVTSNPRSFAPTGLAALASPLLERGHEVSIVDGELGDDEQPRGKFFRRTGMSDEQLREAVTGFAPDVVGISCMFVQALPGLAEAAAVVRSVFDGPILAGGYGPASVPEYTLAETEVDTVVVGEAELALPELIEAGVERGRIVRPQAERDLEKIPRPAYGLLDFDAYRKFDTSYVGMPTTHDGLRAVSVQATRGCPVGCTFCSVQLVTGKVHRKREPARLVDDLIHLRDEHGAEKILFVDDNLTLDPKHTLAVLREMIDRDLGLPWSAQSGIAAWTWTDDLLDAAAESGLTHVIVPVESASDRVLSEVMHKKPLRSIDFPDTIRRIRQRGLPLLGWGVVGNPGETKPEIELTLDLMNELDLDYRLVCIAMPYPGSQLYRDCAEKGFIETPLDFQRLHKQIGLISTPEFSAAWITARVAAWSLRGRIKVSQGVVRSLRRLVGEYGPRTAVRAAWMAAKNAAADRVAA